jgi:hypothetical protein
MRSPRWQACACACVTRPSYKKTSPSALSRQKQGARLRRRPSDYGWPPSSLKARETQTQEQIQEQEQEQEQEAPARESARGAAALHGFVDVEAWNPAIEAETWTVDHSTSTIARQQACTSETTSSHTTVHDSLCPPVTPDRLGIEP